MTGDRPGRLLRSRVVSDVGVVLEDALDRRLTGYATLEARDALLGGDDGEGVLTFENGVPTLAYHGGTDRGGPDALAAFGAGPYRLELYELSGRRLRSTPDRRVRPALPAERLAGDQELADRTRRLAPETAPDSAGDALDAFLADEERIEAIRSQARAEAERRAEEWGFSAAIE